MRIDVVTLFPEMIAGALDFSIMARARDAGLVSFGVHNPRDWTTDRHRVVDDTPYGGGPGMVLKPEPLTACLEEIIGEDQPAVILMTPQGERLSQEHARRLSMLDRLVVVCGHYEAIDERVRQRLITEEISIGDYVLTGGELPALVLIDAVVRLVPGVLGNEASAAAESFGNGLLEHPHYTRPPQFRGMSVPQALLEGDHARVRRWRRKTSLLRTLRRRADLLARAELSEDDRELLAEIANQGLSAPEAGSEDT
ncbi:MAG: tRNA (guanosine(37)-N1)-methyltransferase TrmD [Armatimonadota bacterium]|nr:tRNA (guanosine(37)-N1)-methyltransferase TrmD [Armatimonadota bacterium]